jgi:hypothetical protein
LLKVFVSADTPNQEAEIYIGIAQELPFGLLASAFAYFPKDHTSAYFLQWTHFY